MAEVVTDLDALRELKTRRARLVIPEEMIFRMVGTRTDYLVLSVHTEFDTQRVIMLVAHPDLREVPSGAIPPELYVDNGVWSETRVIDGELYRRVEMEIGPPGELGRPVSAEQREQLRQRLQAILDTGAPEVQLADLLARLVEVAAAGDVPFSAARFLEWLQ